MPLISQFYGILIYLYKELGGHHNEPHIHNKYEMPMPMTLEGKILDGNIPNKQKKIIEAWRLVHEDELRAAWYAYNKDGEIVKIKGLEWFFWDQKL